VHIPAGTDSAAGLLETTLEKVIETQALDKRVQDAFKKGTLRALHPRARIDEALKADIIDSNEAKTLRAVFDLVYEVIKVDDFANEELVRQSSPEPSAKKRAPQRKRTASGTKKKRKETEAA
jgi:acyl-CoA dehydrogenase